MPPTGDPAQQRMMMFMPLMFMVFFLWAPSGLVLYWLVSNLLDDRPAVLHQPACSAAPRRRRRADGGQRDVGTETSDASGTAQRGRWPSCEQIVDAMGSIVAVEVSDVEDRQPPVDVQGEEGELLLRRKGEGLDALQHLVNSAYRRDVGRRPAHRHRRHGLPPGQGRRAARRWRGSWSRRPQRPARRRSSVRSTPTRAASSTWRSAGTTTSTSESHGDGFSEEGHHHALAQARALSPAGDAPSGQQPPCSRPTTPSSPSRRRRAGRLGVVRVSGPRRAPIAAIVAARRRPLDATPGDVRAGAARRGARRRRSIKLVVTCFAAPHSYTGEDVVEIRAHGSPVLLDAIVRRAMDAGARLARPGEFTLRAFLNGKLDLVQAEAVADLIEAVTPAQARARLRSARRHAQPRDRGDRRGAVRSASRGSRRRSISRTRAITSSSRARSAAASTAVRARSTRCSATARAAG